MRKLLALDMIASQRTAALTVRLGNHLIHLHLKNSPPIGFIHVVNITINNTIAEGRIKALRHLKKAI